MSNVPYREAVGSIMYAAITVRPDIAFIAGQLAKFCEKPGPTHWKPAKRVVMTLCDLATMHFPSSTCQPPYLPLG
jgi:hypothetical protein